MYEQNIGLINGITAEYLKDLSETIDVGLFKKAIEIATDKGSCRLGYIKGIIRQWLYSNITTLEQLEAHLLQQSQNNKRDFEESKKKEVIKNDTKGRADIKIQEDVRTEKVDGLSREEMLRQIAELDNE